MDLNLDNRCSVCAGRTTCRNGPWRHVDTDGCPGPPEDEWTRRWLADMRAVFDV